MSSGTRTLLRTAAALVALAVVVLVVLYAAFPGVLVRGVMLAQRSSFDFTRQEVVLPAGTVPYL